MGIFDCLKLKKAGIFVDGPNMLRKETHLDLAEVKKKAREFADVYVANVYLDQFAKDKLLEAVINQGFSPIVSSGDVDVAMASDIVFYSLKNNLSHAIIVTRDTDFVPAIRRVKEAGVKIVILSKRFGFSSALKNYADDLVFL